MKKFITILSISLLIVSCAGPSNDCDTANLRDGKAVLVAYKVSKHSHFFLQLVDKETIHDFGSLGGRREPIMNLGDTIDVKYYIVGNRIEIYLDGADYVQEPKNRESRFVCVPGYDYLE